MGPFHGFSTELTTRTWVESVRLSMLGVHATFVPSGDPWRMVLEGSVGRTDHFHSMWTCGNTTLGCVLSRGIAQTGTQQFHRHRDDPTLSACCHVITWGDQRAAVALASALAARFPTHRLWQTAVCGQAPLEVCLGMAAWRRFPALRIVKAKVFLWLDRKNRWVGGRPEWTLKAGASATAANGFAVYAGTIGNSVGFAVEFAVREAGLFKLILRRHQMTDFGVRIVIRKPEKEESKQKERKALFLDSFRIC
jgi:hypothetical protein